MPDHSGQTKTTVATTDLTLRTAHLTAAFCSVVVVIYAVSAAEPAPAIGPFISFAPVFAVCAWLQKDARVTGVSSIQDWGFFVARMAGPDPRVRA